MRHSLNRFLRAACVALFVCGTSLFSLAASADAKKEFNIAADLPTAMLKQFTAQSGEQLLYSVEQLADVKFAPVQGTITAREALDRMVAGTQLRVAVDAKNGALSLVRAAGPNAPSRPAERAAAEEAGAKIKDGAVHLGTFEVFGSKLLNLDVPRTRDDVQPYVVFDHDTIANSQATNITDFFRKRLPMATQLGMPQFTGANSFLSSINLRGLGTNQTLMLVDGRRIPNVPPAGAYISFPPDPSGIPLEMIERIEVLPSTASGIYGGGATGGVINIITRKDFSGAVLTMNYVNTFDTDTARRRVDLNASTNLRGGATVLTLTASWQDANELLVQDRDFALRARQLAFANNPTAFTGTSNVPRGYTPNIRSQNGSNLVLKPAYGGTALNAPITSVPVGYAGIASDSAAALVANAGRYNLELPLDDNGALGRQLGRNSPVTSLGVSLRQKVTPLLEGYADFLRTENIVRNFAPFGLPFNATLSAANPANPFTSAVIVSHPYPNIGRYSNNSSAGVLLTRVTGGFVAKLPGEWQAGLDYAWGRSTNNTRFDYAVLGDPDGPTGSAVSYNTAVSTGALDLLRDLNRHPLDIGPYLVPGMASLDTDVHSLSQSATMRASGPVFRLPTGDVVVSASAEWRKQEVRPSVYSGVNTAAPQPNYSYIPGASGTNESFYLETRIPLLAPLDGATKQPRLELQVAGRHDVSRVRAVAQIAFPALSNPAGPYPALAYNTPRFGSSTYTVGLRYAPLPDFAFRASVGTGFLAPEANQLAATPAFTFTSFFVTDPKRGKVLTDVGPVTYSAGGNPALRPEQSKSVSAGMVFTPRLWPAFRFSVDYTKIHKTDEISFLSDQQLFDFEDALPGVLVRAPLTPADQALGYTGGVVTRINADAVNFARREVEAVDFQADYTRKTALGEFHVYAVATLNRSFAGQVVPTAPKLNEVGFLSSPLKWRGNLGLDWSRGPWSAGWNAQFYDSQLIYTASATPAAIASAVRTQGADHWGSQFYHDAQVSYQLGRGQEGWLRPFSGLKVSVGLQNVFDREPPLQAGTGTRTGFQNIEDPRLRRYSLTLQKRF